jgi:hypothetical protein
MNTQVNEGRNRTYRDFTWVYEVMLFLTVTPALVYGVASLGNLPIVV